MNLLIVDDHPLFLKGLESFLHKEDHWFADVFTSKNCSEAVKSCKENNIDIILMDIHIGNKSGIELTKEIKSDFPNVKVIGLSATNDSQIIKQMMDAEASGFILKDVDIDELKIGVNTVLDGNFYFSSSISNPSYSTANFALNFDLYENSKLKNKLTFREFEMLKYIVEEELGNTEIANKLFISPRTVETHKRNLIQKLDVKNTIGLTKLYCNYKNLLNKFYGNPVA